MRLFSVVNYIDSGHELCRRQTETIREAIEWAQETPNASLCVMDENGWVARTMIFSPKHPVEFESLFNALAGRD